MRKLPVAKTVDEIDSLLPWNLHTTDLIANLTA